jgi:hypothetical protein
MDGVTQQNSALVEENAATAKTLEHQARHMDERISFFDLGTPNGLHPSGRRSRSLRAPAHRLPFVNPMTAIIPEI